MEIDEMIANNEKELITFFEPFFGSKVGTEAFLKWVYEYDWNNRIPRQMINQVYRFVTLSSRIDKIWPARDGLRIVFLKTCLESLCYLSNESKKTFYKVFSECFSKRGTDWILSHFRLSSYSEIIDNLRIDSHYNLTMHDVCEVIKIVRDKVVHEGNYWEIQIFAYGEDKDAIWPVSFLTEEKFLADRTIPKAKHEVEYCFETTLYFEDFAYFFTEACINYVKKFIRHLQENKA